MLVRTTQSKAASCMTGMNQPIYLTCDYRLWTNGAQTREMDPVWDFFTLALSVIDIADDLVYLSFWTTGRRLNGMVLTGLPSINVSYTWYSDLFIFENNSTKHLLGWCNETPHLMTIAQFPYSNTTSAADTKWTLHTNLDPFSTSDSNVVPHA